MALLQNNPRELSIGDTFNEVLRKNRDLVIRIQNAESGKIILHTDTRIIKNRPKSQQTRRKNKQKII